MARASPIQNSFAAGEFSPLLQGRTDADRYKQGLARCLNAIPLLQGPVTRRAGSRYVAAVAEAGNYTRLIPFRYSVDQAYMLEFGFDNNVMTGYIRFYTNRAQIQVLGVPYSIPSPYTLAELPFVKFTQSLDILYLVHPDHPPYKLLRYGNTDWVLEEIAFYDGPYLNVGYPSAVTKVTHITKLEQINASAATGSITLTSKIGDYLAYGITAIVNNGAGECRITVADSDDFQNRSQVFVNGATGTTGANGTFIAKKISATQYDLVGSVFNAAYLGGGQIAPAPFTLLTDVGRLIRVKVGANNWGYAEITAVTNGATATAQVINTLTAGGTTTEFRFGLWSDTTGYPSCCTFHEDRLYLGGAGGALQRIDGSTVSDYENFAPTEDDGTIVDSNAVSFSLNSNDANAVNWMTSDERGLPIGTSGGPWILRPSILNEAITARNVSAKRVNNVGAADVQALIAGKSTIYIESSTRKIQELSYFYDVDGFRSVDLSEIAENLPAEGISTEIVYQRVPQPIVWCGRSDGVFLGMTYDRNLDSLRSGWHRHILGGVSDTSGTPPVIESFAVIPSPDGTVDDVWFTVKRYINGSTVRYVEYLDKIFESFDLQQDAFYVDCGATFDNPLTVTSISTANPAVVNVTGHGLATGDKVRFQDIRGLFTDEELEAFEDDPEDPPEGINGALYDVTVVNANQFSVDGLDSTELSPFIAGGVVRKQVSNISGITWLANETVSILGDGAVISEATVNGAGVLTLAYPAGVVQFGLGYKTQIQQLRLDAGSADGTSIGKNRRIESVAVLLNRSDAFMVGMNFNDTEMVEQVIREADDPTDEAAPLFTGVKSLSVFSDYDFENQLAFEVSTPTPFTLQAIMPQITSYDKG